MKMENVLHLKHLERKIFNLITMKEIFVIMNDASQVWSINDQWRNEITNQKVFDSFDNAVAEMKINNLSGTIMIYYPAFYIPIIK